MDRGKFIKISSMAAAAAMFNNLAFAESKTGSVMNLPDEVWARSGDVWFKLRFSAGVYTYHDIEVRLQHSDMSQSVFVQSPSMPLQDVQLRWKYSQSANAKYLGDAWERAYGDLEWVSTPSNVKTPWYLLVYNSTYTNCFGVKTGCNTFCSWLISAGTLRLNLDTRNAGSGVQLGTRELHCADIVTMQSRVGESPFHVAQRFCKLMCSQPRLPKLPVYGINDWYYAYGNNSAALIHEQTAIMAGLVSDTENRPFSVIDAGWAQYSPLLPGDCCWQDDFSKPNDKFKDMQLVAADIKKLGMRPGLWTRPLCAKHNDPNSLLLPAIPGRDNPKNPVLDPTISENLERVKHNIETYKQWGFELVKHDFSTFDITGRWGFEMAESLTVPQWSFYDKSKTTAEVILNLYSNIRNAAGDMYLIGCDTVSHLSAGVFELNRAGDDTSGKEWARTRKMGVNTLGFRLPQHNAFYATDGDCVGLTKDVAWQKNKQWMQLLAESGTPLFISAQPNVLGTEQKSLISKSFAQAAKVQTPAEPLDWLTNKLPVKWKLNNREVLFDWS